jgi:thiol-disulfide isomerase/thioredoxin
MSVDILIRFVLALGIIGVSIFLYKAVNRRLLLRAQSNMFSLFNTPLDKPVIVYFTTPDCAPCKAIQRPALNQLSGLMGDTLRVIEIDATQQPDVARRWGVMSVPTTFLLDAGGNARYVNTGVARIEKLMDQLRTL